MHLNLSLQGGKGGGRSVAFLWKKRYSHAARPELKGGESSGRNVLYSGKKRKRKEGEKGVAGLRCRGGAKRWKVFFSPPILSEKKGKKKRSILFIQFPGEKRAGPVLSGKMKKKKEAIPQPLLVAGEGRRGEKNRVCLRSAIVLSLKKKNGKKAKVPGGEKGGKKEEERPRGCP